MYKKIVYATACSSLLFFAASLSYAEQGVDYNENRIIFTGNTIEGKVIKRGTEYKMYLHPSGKMIRLDNKDNIEKGIWHINNKNELCLKVISEQCRTIKKRGDGKYDLYSQNGDLELTIVKVTIGNPKKMKP